VSRGWRSFAARQFPLVLPLIFLVLAWPWAFFGLLRFARWPLWARILAGACWLTLTVGLFLWAPTWWAKSLVFVGSVVIVPVLWFSHRPKLEGDWVEEQAEVAMAEFDGDLVTIRNFRHSKIHDDGKFEVRFEDRKFDLSQTQSVDFLIVPFSDWRGLAHVFVTFGFSDGEYLAISVEARREGHEPYSPLGGLFSQYEVIYVVGDERDLLGKRVFIQKDPTYLYSMIADADAARGLLVSMLEEANELAEKPQFYHTVTNTCTSNVLQHATKLEVPPKRYDFRLVFPGFSDGLAVECGLIDAPDGLDTLRENALINERAQCAPMDDGKAWSKAIREKSSCS